MQSQHPERVRLIDVNARAKLLRHFDLRPQVGNIAGHAEDAVHDDKLSGFVGLAFETVAEGNGGVVPVGNKLRWRELAAVDDTGMIFTVAENHVSFFGE